jgi:hypothetical protein
MVKVVESIVTKEKNIVMKVVESITMVVIMVSINGGSMEVFPLQGLTPIFYSLKTKANLNSTLDLENYIDQ